MMFKRLFSVFLILTLTFVSFAAVSANGDANIYSDEIKVLYDIGILDASMDMNSEVTRGAFISAAVKLMGAADLPAENVFEDVSAESKYCKEINFAYNAGLVSGVTEKTFEPDSAIKLNQAAKILCCILGYKTYAEYNGGYPVGYLTSAAEAGILKGVNQSREKISWTEAAKMLYNAAHANTMEFCSYPNGSYEKNYEETLLRKYLHIDTETGIVKANDVTSLSAQSGVNDGFVKINDELYKSSESAINDCLGYKVSVYYKESDSADREIVTFSVNSNVKEINLDCSEVSEDTNENRIVYFDENGTKKSLSVLADAVYIFNGINAGRKFSRADILIPNGELRLADGDGDGKIDVIFASVPKIYFADSIYADVKIVTDKHTGSSLDLSENNDTKVCIYKNGEVTDFSSISKNNVLKVIESTDGKLIKVWVSDKKMKGKVSETNGSKILVGGKEYETDPFCAESLKNEIEIGNVYTFFLGDNGKIAGASVIEGLKNYAYLIDASPIKKGISSKDGATFRLLDVALGEIVNYNSAGNIKLNGERVTASGETLTGKKIAEILSPGGVISNQVIKYELDKNDLISEICTPKKNTSEPFKEDKEDLTLDFDYPRENSGHVDHSYLVYEQDNGGILSNYISMKKAVGILLPKLEGGETMRDREDEIRIFSPNTQWGDSEKITNIMAYDMDKDHMPAIVTTEGGSVNDPPDNFFFCVDKVTNAVNKNGEMTVKLYGYYKGEYVDYEIDTNKMDINSDDLKLVRGDVIRILKNQKGICKIWKTFTSKPEDGRGGYQMDANNFCDCYMGLNASSYAKLYFCYWDLKHVALHCGVESLNNSQIRVTLDGDRLMKKIVPLESWCRVYVYDESTDTLKIGSVSSIHPGDERQSVVAYIEYQTAQEIFVLNRKEAVSIGWNGKY